MQHTTSTDTNKITLLRTHGPQSGATSSDLLAFYFSLSPEQRKSAFASTARAAEIAGLSQRTIQFWVQIGAVRAIHVGKKYQVDVRSLLQHASDSA